MAKIKLTYFDIPGGRAEPARLALRIAGIDFEDERLSFEQFRAMRDGTPFGTLPTAVINGQLVTQSNAINHYVGKLTGLYPDDSLQALYCDEAMGAVEDIMHHVVQTFGLEGEALKQAREKLVEGRLTTYARGLADRLERSGGQYFADGRMTIGDLKVFVWVRGLRSGNLDHVPLDLLDRVAPALVEHQRRVEEDPRLQPIL